MSFLEAFYLFGAGLYGVAVSEFYLRLNTPQSL